MNDRLEALEMKAKGMQHLLGATDADLQDAHDEAVQLAAAAEAEAKKNSVEDTKAAELTVAQRIAARLKK